MAFDQKTSATLLLSIFIDDVNDHLNARKNILLVFIDYSKAFDTLRHETFLNK